MTDLGRYAVYIWPAFGATIVGFAWMILDSVLTARRWRREVERLEKNRRP